MKEFSILQAVYKNDNPIFLDICFQSIKTSTNLPNKIILVRDGEIPEALSRIIKKWEKELPIEEYGYTENKGLAYALNFGMQFISTELTARMDSDDYCYPNRFQKQIEFFEKNENVQICGTGILEFYEKNDYKKYRFYPDITSKYSKSLYKGTPLAHPTVMIKTDLLKKYKYREDTMMNEDIDLWFRLLQDGYELFNINEPLLNFRITDGTFKRRSFAKAKKEFNIYWENLINLFGFSFSLIYPILRFLSRFLPYNINKKLYFSNLRNNLFRKK